MVIEVRQAEISDLSLLSELAAAINRQHFPPILGEKAVEELIRLYLTPSALLRQMQDGVVYHLAYADGLPAGYCAHKLEKDCFFIDKLYVRQEFRGQRIGRAMYDHMLRLRQDRTRIHLTVNQGSTTARKVYAHLGFRQVDTILSENGPAWTLYLLEKDLEEKDMDISIRRVEQADVPVLAALADEIWHQHFTPIIGAKQVDYMLDWFQDEEAMTRQLQEGMIYHMAYAGGEPIGYCGCKLEEDRLFLSKLYVKKAFRGRGIGRMLFNRACSFGAGKRAVYLTVNKHNDDTIAIYKKMGFLVIDSVVSDIGNGFVMDDYIMELPL